MQRTSMSNMHNTLWHENQVVVTFYSSQHVTEFTRESAIAFLVHQKSILNKFLEEIRSPFTLDFLGSQNIQHSAGEAPRTASGRGIYVFGVPAQQNATFLLPKIAAEIQTSLVGFFSFSEAKAVEGIVDDKQDEEPEDEDRDDHGHSPMHAKIGSVPRIVNLINNNLDKLSSGEYQVLAAHPSLLCAATQNLVTQGCPVIPPIPVSPGTGCLSSPGLFPFEFALTDKPIGATGEGVTVCILDTLPRRERITQAAHDAGENNKLLLDVDKNVQFTYDYDSLVDSVDPSGHLTVGKDINGVHNHARLPDHGLFIAGIVRSIASAANIECIRVLNDFCVGDMNVLLQSLQDIQQRMREGDLHGKPVVVNMSLVIPTDEEGKQKGIKIKSKNMIRTALALAIESLVELGAVFVASAGNEGDKRDNPSGHVPNALYPSAFADDIPHGVISVGAANSAGKPTTYSCFPGLNGIAVYGGEIPTPKPPTDGCFTRAENIDALIGIYSSDVYPSLSVDDCEPTYRAPNSNGWAYWSGTSFATPIISAILARLLEKSPLTSSISLVVPISNAVAASPIAWTDINAATNPDGSGTEFGGRMIHMAQCKGEATEQS